MNLNKIGKLGEDIAVTFLKRKGFTIYDRNYLKKQGEIDIVAIKAGIYHFIEVKSVSREIIDGKPAKGDFIEPEENMHKDKIRRLSNAISIFLSANRILDKEYKFDLCIVYIDTKQKKSLVKWNEDFPLSYE